MEKIRGEFKASTDALTARLVVVETARSEGTAATGTSASVSAEGEGTQRGAGESIEIEMKEGETEAQALARTVDEIIAQKRGSPSPTKK